MNFNIYKYIYIFLNVYIVLEKYSLSTRFTTKYTHRVINSAKSLNIFIMIMPAYPSITVLMDAAQKLCILYSLI